MHLRHVDLLCCPETGQRLTLQNARALPGGRITTGQLVSPSGRVYPILRGIPRFISAERYAGSFGYEWTRWPRVQFDDANIGRPMEGHTARMFRRITDIDDRMLPGRTIVEFGCGPGRFLDVLRRKGACAVGLDMSHAVESARRNFGDDPDVLIVQGDLMNPPLRSGAFDGGYSIGVLHHTPDPRAGFAALARCVRPGGWIAASVYSAHSFYDYPSVARFRRLHRVLAPRLGYRPALAYAHLSAYVISPLLRRLRNVPALKPAVDYIERNWLVSLYIKDVRWRLLDIFDAITPAWASTHTRQQVLDWFASCGCADIRPTYWGPTSVVGHATQRSSSQQRRAA